MIEPTTAITGITTAAAMAVKEMPSDALLTR